MTNHISQTDPRKLSTEEIFSEIDGFKSLAVNVLKRWSALLAELKRRRVSNIMFNHPVLKFWESISNQSLNAEAAVLLADKSDGKMIKAVLPLQPDEQLNIAHGALIPVATVTDSGDIKSDDMPIFRMDAKTLNMAFGPEGVRTVYDQAQMIKEEGKIERIGHITVLRDEVMLKIGNQKIKPEELRGPLMALGYRLDLSRSVQDKAS